MPAHSNPKARPPTIKDLPPEGRPRERLIAKGPESLSLAELLALIIRTGNPASGETALGLANRVMSWAGGKEEGLSSLLHAEVEELKAIPGIGTAKAVEIKASLELGRRMARSGSLPAEIRSPGDVFDLVAADLEFQEEEHIKAILLSIKNGILGVETISRGGLAASVVSPREIFRAAIRRNAAGLILVHNHPSGDPAPSAEDYVMTEAVVKAGRLLGVELLDHVIVGHGRFVSLRETPRGWDIWMTGKGEPGQC